MERTELTKKKKLISQYKKVFSGPDGRAVLHDLMRGNSVIWKTPHVVGDTESTFKNIGRQELVVDILTILKMDPEKFLGLLAEQEESHV